MSTDETYDGWSNRETWAVALHINNDQGWQESVHEALTDMLSSDDYGLDALRRKYSGTDADRLLMQRNRAGDIIRENVEETLDGLLYDGIVGRESSDASREAASFYRGIVSDIGSLWRVSWDELGAAFLADLGEQNS